MAEILTHNQTFATPGEALAHYGVKGMKWGVRKDDKTGGSNGSSSTPSRSPEKQQKIDERVANLRAQAAKADVAAKEWYDVAASRPDTFLGRMSANQDRQMALNNEARRDVLNKTADAVEEGRLTPNQKKLLIGGAIVGGLVLAAYGSSKMESGELNALKLRGQAALRGERTPFRRREEWAGKLTPDEAWALSKDVNPGYASPGGQMNCRRSTLTYELRRRGYDVDATTSAIGYGQSETGLLNALTPGERNRNSGLSLSANVASGAGIRGRVAGDTRAIKGDRYSVSDANDRKALFDTIMKQPDGARGEAVFNFTAFGHSLAYERFGDKAYIFDSQKGQRYDVADDASYRSFIDKWGGSLRVKDIEMTRLDNADLDLNFLARWSTTRDPNKPPVSVSSLPKPKTPATSTLSPRQMAIAKGPRPPDMHITTYNSLRREAGLGWQDD